MSRCTSSRAPSFCIGCGFLALPTLLLAPMDRTPPPLQPLAVAKLFKEVVTKEEPGLVLLGKQSIDGDCAQTGPMLAALLGWPQATFACKVWRRPPPFSRPQRRF